MQIKKFFHLGKFCVMDGGQEKALYCLKNGFSDPRRVAGSALLGAPLSGIWKISKNASPAAATCPPLAHTAMIICKNADLFGRANQ